MNYAGRVDALVERMRENGLDLVLLFDRDNIRYFTGFRLNRVVTSILAVSPDEGPTYIVAKLDLNRAKRDGWIDRVIPFPEDAPNYLDALCPLFGGSGGRIGIEKDSLSLAQAEYLRGLSGEKSEFVDVRAITSELRAIKSDAEIARLRRAAEIASCVMERVQEA
ncbi:MAG: aminopeptidase P family N-terminal domain-containing protein, partial [Methanoculleaceae archaeon]